MTEIYTIGIEPEELSGIVRGLNARGRFKPEVFDLLDHDHGFTAKRDDQEARYKTHFYVLPTGDNATLVEIENEPEDTPHGLLAWNKIRAELEGLDYPIRAGRGPIKGPEIPEYIGRFKNPDLIYDNVASLIVRAFINKDKSGKKYTQRDIAEEVGTRESYVSDTKKRYLRPEIPRE
jgi:hypothetical protein